MTRKLSKRQKALYVVAEAYGTPEKERTPYQVYLTKLGICAGVEYVCAFDLIQLGCALEVDTDCVYLCDMLDYPNWTPACDLWRSDLASFLAAMTDEEYNDAFEVEL